MQEEETTYTLEKLWGLGPLKKEAPVENPGDVVNLERYKVHEVLIHLLLELIQSLIIIINFGIRRLPAENCSLSLA